MPGDDRRATFLGGFEKLGKLVAGFLRAFAPNRAHLTSRKTVQRCTVQVKAHCGDELAAAWWCRPGFGTASPLRRLARRSEDDAEPISPVAQIVDAALVTARESI
jgi:hypothetical protein